MPRSERGTEGFALPSRLDILQRGIFRFFISPNVQSFEEGIAMGHLAAFWGSSQTRIASVACLIWIVPLFVSHAVAQTVAAESGSASKVVQVPALVTDESGSIVFGLKASDFAVMDNGKEQDIKLDAVPDIQEISLVVCVQNGGSANLLFKGGKNEFHRAQDMGEEELTRQGAVLGGLGTMVENFIGKSMKEVAVVAFDSRVSFVQDFTGDLNAVRDALNSIEGRGDSGAAILDAVSFSLDLLTRRMGANLRVLLLISETRDQGSRGIKLDTLLLQAASGNTLVYCAAFSSLRLEAAHDLKTPQTASPQIPQNAEPVRHPAEPDPVKPGYDLLGPLARLITDAAAENAPRKIADFTGGEYRQFSDKRTFDAALGAMANRLRNTYRISFRPGDPAPGFHNISVRLRNGPEDAGVRTRRGYWVGGREEWDFGAE